MKANELMIGDWVNIYVFPNESPKKKDLFPAIITTIMTPLPNEQGGEHIECIFKSEDGGIGCATRPVNTCLPIPLTPEILEKNNFREGHASGCPEKWRLIYTTITMNVYSHSGRDVLWRLSVDTNRNENTVVYIHYVHELQNALRLCGIDKTIEL